MKIKYASFGSVSSGTMRTDDLLQSLSYELDYQMKRQVTRFPRRALRKLLNNARRRYLAMVDDNGNLSDEADFILTELFDALGQFAPPYAYFGSIEGDGADYGYWLSPTVVEDFDGLKVGDTSEVPASYSGEVLHINDHGNATLYVARRGKLTEIWGVV